MVLDPIKLLQYSIDKEMKISHLDDCKAVVCKKEEVPADIMSKISDQYDEKFTDDADVIMFVKGPIDKKKVEKIFKCSDRAFGAEANGMVVGDFKLLKMKDSDEDLSISDDSDETPDAEIDEIVNDDAEGEDIDSSNEDVNDEAIDDALNSEKSKETQDDVDNDEEDKTGDDESDEESEDEDSDDDEESEDAEDEESEDGDDEDDSEEDEEVDESMNEAGLTPDQMMALFAKRKEIDDARKAAEDAERSLLKVKEVWIKSLDLDKDVAELQITYSDGKVADEKFDISTTGSDQQNSKFIAKHLNGSRYYSVSGDKFKQEDKFYKELEQNLKKGKGKPGCLPRNLEVSDEDVRVSMIRVPFNDWRIKWYYGKDKKAEPWYAFSRAGQENYTSTKDNRSLEKAMSGERSDNAFKGREVYSDGNTKIYKVGENELNEADEDGSEETDEEKPALPTKYVFIKITLKK